MVRLDLHRILPIAATCISNNRQSARGSIVEQGSIATWFTQEPAGKFATMCFPHRIRFSMSVGVKKV